MLECISQVIPASPCCSCPLPPYPNLPVGRRRGRDWGIQGCSKYISASCVWNGASLTSSSSSSNDIHPWLRPLGKFRDLAVLSHASSLRIRMSPFACLRQSAQGLGKVTFTTGRYAANLLYLPITVCFYECFY